MTPHTTAAPAKGPITRAELEESLAHHRETVRELAARLRAVEGSATEALTA